MSDQYSFDPADPVDFMQRRAQAQAQLALDASPDDAARAMDLSRATGVPAPVVAADQERFDKNFKGQLVSGIIDNNQYIRDYINAHPLAAAASNDDYGQLDETSRALQKLDEMSVMKAFGRGFSEGFDHEGLMDEYSKLVNFVDNPAWRAFVNYTGFGNLALAAGASTHAFTGALYGLGESVGQISRNITGNDAWSARLTRDAIQIGQVALSGQAGPHAPMPEPLRAAKRAEPYLSEGKPPPIGLDPIIDDAYKQQAAEDKKALSEALREAGKSSTRERSPELFEAFMAQHTNQDIGVPADAIRALYGDKVPAPDDGVLGWVPRLQEQLQAAEKTGADVQIPLAKWLTYIPDTPEIAKALEDHVRFREGGFTPAEAKDGFEVYHGSPHEFEAFDIGKVGTGEGAQSYGFGHYFAENPEVAKSYSTTEGSNEILNFARNVLDYHKGDRAAAIEGLRKDIATATQEQWLDVARPALYMLESGTLKEEGQFYKARILRRPEEFLDYDAKLSEQPQAVMDFVKEYRLDQEDLLGPGLTNESTGADFYHKLENRLGSNPQEASRRLAEAGIAGIKYLDQFSRGVNKHERRLAEISDEQGRLKDKGAENLSKEEMGQWETLEAERQQLLKDAEGTRNFVVFRDQDIQVLERNGEVLASLRQAAGLLPKSFPEIVKTDLGEGEVVRGTGAARVPEGMSREEALRPGYISEAEATQPLDYSKPTVAPDITKAVFEKYGKLIAEQREADRNYILEKATKDARRRQTQTWKENEVRVRQEVVNDFKDLPYIAADTYFREGKVGDVEMPKPKLGREFLTEKEIALLPKDFVSERGMPPDDAAAMVGYGTGKELVASLAKFESDRKAAGKRPMDFRRLLVDQEVETRMRERYGDLSDKIIEDAKEHALAELELQRLNEEALITALEAGMDYTEARAALEAGRQEALAAFEETLVKDVSSDRLMANIGRKDRLAEQAILKGEAADALVNRERKYISAVLARRAMEVEKIAEDTRKLAKKYSTRDQPKVARDATNYIRGLLSEAGYDLKITPDEIARAIKEEGHGSFADYVATKAQFGWEPDVSARIAEAGPGKLDTMSVAEFRELADALKSLDTIGRKENQIVLRGQAQDFADWRKSVKERLSKRPIRDAAETAKGGKWAYRMEAPWTRMEEIAKDIDFREELGPFYEAVMVPYEMAKADEMTRMRDLTAQITALKKEKGFDNKWYRTLDEKISHDFIHDTWYDAPFELTRWNLIKIALNLGNEGNAGTLIDGIARAQVGGKKPTPEHLAATDAKVSALVNTHLTAQDWKFVQSIWDLFGQFEKDIYALNYTTGGKEVKFVKPREVETPHGTLKGGYFPLIPDPLRNVKMTERAAPEIKGPLGQDYFRANTNQNHLIARTGARYFVDISNGPEQLFGRLQQVVHDLSFREFVIDAGKVIYDAETKNMLRKYYGIEYEQLFEPWLKRVANNANAPEKELAAWNSVARWFRMNLVAYALPLNYAVEFSPSVGLANFKSIAEFNMNRAMNKKLVMEQSKELAHTMYSIDRDVGEAINRVLGQGKYTSFQMRAMETMFKPLVWLEQQFRMATFYKEYMKQKEAGRTDYEAGVLADSLIRERHGTGAVGDIPMIMSNPNEFVKIATVFMGYFTSQRNWMRQLPHAVREGDYSNMAKILWGTVMVNGLVNAALFERRKKDDNFFSFMGRAFASTPLMMVPYVRDVWNYYTQGYRPTASILSAMLSLGEVLKDGYKAAFDKKPLKHPVRDMAAVMGQIGGVPGTLQVGRTGQFVYDVKRGMQKPQGFVEWMRGIFTGRSKLEK